jgi:2-methylisocitrate lyase-like PEP mutase family enzyme
LRDDALIGRICDGVALPVNVMVMEGVPSTRRLSELDVARVSYGAIPCVRAMKALGEDARQVLP